jgi:drug/metabolite transporter (DMT)-like permease
MLTKLSPFFVAIFALGFLGERPPRAVMVAMSVAFVGGLFIVKPRFDLSVLPALSGLCSSLFAGGAYTALRALRTREAAETIVFHFSLVTVVLLSPLLAIDPHLPRGGEWGELLGIGVFAAIGQIGLTLAYRYAPAAQVSIYSYTTILFSALLGFAVWAEVPDLPSLIGGVLIVAGGIGGYLADRSARPRFGREAHGGRHENDRPASG